VCTASQKFIGLESACYSDVMHIKCSVQLSGMWLCMLLETAKLLEENCFYLGSIDEGVI